MNKIRRQNIIYDSKLRKLTTISPNSNTNTKTKNSNIDINIDDKELYRSSCFNFVILLIAVVNTIFYNMAVFETNAYEKNPYYMSIWTFVICSLNNKKFNVILFIFEFNLILNVLYKSYTGFVEGKYHLYSYPLFLYCSPYIILLSRFFVYLMKK